MLAYAWGDDHLFDSRLRWFFAQVIPPVSVSVCLFTLSYKGKNAQKISLKDIDQNCHIGKYNIQISR